MQCSIEAKQRIGKLFNRSVVHRNPTSVLVSVEGNVSNVCVGMVRSAAGAKISKDAAGGQNVRKLDRN